MTNQDTSLDDIAQSIVNLGTMISQQIESTKTEIIGELSSFKLEIGFGVFITI